MFQMQCRGRPRYRHEHGISGRAFNSDVGTFTSVLHSLLHHQLAGSNSLKTANLLNYYKIENSQFKYDE